MSLNDPRLTILDFDGTYGEQAELCTRFPHHWVDFRALRQARLYCAVETFRTIERTLATPAAGTPVTLLGCGDYHFVTLALLERVRRPVTLVLVDHHTDSRESMLGNLISCGSWIHHAFARLPNLAGVVMVGPPPDAVRTLPAAVRARIRFLPNLAPERIDGLFRTLPATDVYLSVDKDALEPTVVRTNWDQGELPLRGLLAFIARLEKERHLCGADICGELPASPLDLLQPDTRRLIGLNEHANERLLDALLCAG